MNKLSHTQFALKSYFSSNTIYFVASMLRSRTACGRLMCGAVALFDYFQVFQLDVNATQSGLVA